MSKKFAFLFPGQGAQYPGMGKDFYEQFSIAKETFQEADELLGTPFSRIIFEGTPVDLTLTKNSQLAIYIVSIAIMRTVQQQFPDLIPSVCAGLSLGEYSALCAAEKLGFSECLLLVKNRATYMNEACLEREGSLRVVLGLDSSIVEALMQEISAKHSVFVANLNCPGQVVIAGSPEGLDAAAEILKQKGAKRILPLEVSGAFHTPFMQSAQDKLAPHIESCYLKESLIDIVMNVPGDYVSSIEQMRSFMIRQVTSPTRWAKGIEAMMAKDIDMYFELGCGTTLSGMNKKIGVTKATCSVQKVSDLEEIAKMRETVCVC